MEPNYLETRLEKNKENLFYKIKKWFRSLFLKPEEINDEIIIKNEVKEKYNFTDNIKINNEIETRRRKTSC